MALNRIIRTINIIGNGQQEIEIPEGYDFATIANATNYSFKIYEGVVDDSALLAEFTTYADRCVPLNTQSGNPRIRLIVKWTGTGTGKVTITFSPDPLPLNQNLNTSGASSNMTLIGDTVGIAKQAQLPGALTAGGNLKAAVVERAVVGAQANAWNAAVTGAGGTSASIDMQYQQTVSGFGNVNGATTVTLQVSQNNVNFYDAGNVVLGGAGDFHLSVTTGARYARLKSSASVTATATLAAK